MPPGGSRGYSRGLDCAAHGGIGLGAGDRGGGRMLEVVGRGGMKMQRATLQALIEHHAAALGADLTQAHRGTPELTQLLVGFQAPRVLGSG